HAAGRGRDAAAARGAHVARPGSHQLRPSAPGRPDRGGRVRVPGLAAPQGQPVACVPGTWSYSGPHCACRCARNHTAMNWNATFRRAEGLELREVSDGFVVYDARQDRLHYLNLTATMLLECCDGTT